LKEVSGASRDEKSMATRNWLTIRVRRKKGDEEGAQLT